VYISSIPADKAVPLAGRLFDLLDLLGPTTPAMITHAASLLDELTRSPHVTWPGGVTGEEWLASEKQQKTLRGLLEKNPTAVVWLFAHRADPASPSPALRALEASRGPDYRLFPSVLTAELDRTAKVPGDGKDHQPPRPLLWYLLLARVPSPLFDLLDIFRSGRCHPCGEEMLKVVVRHCTDLVREGAREGEVAAAMRSFQEVLVKVRAAHLYIMYTLLCIFYSSTFL
jgi:hypothetical protein